MGRRRSEPLDISDPSRTLTEFAIYLKSTRHSASDTVRKYVSHVTHFLEDKSEITKNDVIKFMDQNERDHNGKVQTKKVEEGHYALDLMDK